ncbi:MAG TPA: response regulator, partial [Casimicrobiaceae bacterium]
MNSNLDSLGGEARAMPKVLVVDDDEVSLLLTSHALRERNFDVTEATSGERALELVRVLSPDVVVLDALMPGLDGFETCHRLRGLSGFETLPVLMLTGLDDEASITRAYEVGATDFFVKSSQWSLLGGRLRHLLRSSRTRIELERSKSKLARAQDLARMGSFDWPMGRIGPVLSIECTRVLGLAPDVRLSLRKVVRLVAAEARGDLMDTLQESL